MIPLEHQLEAHISRNDDPRSLPLISVVVAVLNAADTLQRCIDSIADQTYAHKELIMMDGGSTDGCIEILKQNNGKISYWESEADGGIYHAWNKAIRRAHGDYVCFLGADDYWFDNTCLARLVKVSVRSGFPDLISGKVAVVDANGMVLETRGAAWNPARMRKWMVVAHPGMLHRRALFEKIGMFSEQYKIAADYHFLLRCGATVSWAFVDEVVVCMGHKGFSRRNVNVVLRETFFIQSANRDIGLAKACVNFCIAYAKHIAKRLLCRN